MMKKMWVGLFMLVTITGLLFIVSCAPKVVESTPPESPEVTVSDVDKKKAEELAKQESLAKSEMMTKAARDMFINEDVYFDYDQSVLSPDAQDIIRRKADWLKGNDDVKIVIEGHCDERGTTEYNLALGDRRAENAKTFLVDIGIDASKISKISYGEEQPIDPGQNEEAWAKNRRAHFTID